MGIEEYDFGVAITIIVLNALSAAALVFICIIYMTGAKKTNNFPMRMVFYLCIACFLQNVYVFIYNPIMINNKEVITEGTDSLCNF
jgi:hypothetical protein